MRLTLLILVSLLAGSAILNAAIFPDQIGGYHKSAPKTIGIPDQALYDEYGLDATEAADYTLNDPAAKTKSSKRFSAVAWRLHDSTGALALFQFRRPPGAVKANFTELSVRTSDGVIFAYGNYVFQFTGGQPEQKDLPAFYAQLTKFEHSPLPALIGYPPEAGLIPNSERYILGPVSLQRFEPGIAPSTAAFHLGAEAETAKYQTPKGPLDLIIFNYPTPSMARQQANEMQKIPGALVKRTGPLVAVTIAPPDADDAERILGKVNYLATVTEGEKVPQNEVKGFAKSLLNMFALAGIILCLCVVAGVGFGWFRVVGKKIFHKEDPDAMIVLGLRDTAGAGSSGELGNRSPTGR
jgi:hypothetical protein